MAFNVIPFEPEHVPMIDISDIHALEYPPEKRTVEYWKSFEYKHLAISITSDDAVISCCGFVPIADQKTAMTWCMFAKGMDMAGYEFVSRAYMQEMDAYMDEKIFDRYLACTMDGSKKARRWIEVLGFKKVAESSHVPGNMGIYHIFERKQ